MATQCPRCRAVHPDGWTVCRFCGAQNPLAREWSSTFALMQCTRCSTVNVLGWTRCSRCGAANPAAGHVPPDPARRAPAPPRPPVPSAPVAPAATPVKQPPGWAILGGIAVVAVIGFSVLNSGGAARRGQTTTPARQLSAAECRALDRQWQDARDAADLYDAIYNGGPLPEEQRRDVLRRQGEAVDRMQDLLDRQDAGGCFD